MTPSRPPGPAGARLAVGHASPGAAAPRTPREGLIDELRLALERYAPPEDRVDPAALADDMLHCVSGSVLDLRQLRAFDLNARLCPRFLTSMRLDAWRALSEFVKAERGVEIDWVHLPTFLPDVRGMTAADVIAVMAQGMKLARVSMNAGLPVLPARIPEHPAPSDTDLLRLHLLPLDKRPRISLRFEYPATISRISVFAPAGFIIEAENNDDLGHIASAKVSYYAGPPDNRLLGMADLAFRERGPGVAAGRTDGKKSPPPAASAGPAAPGPRR